MLPAFGEVVYFDGSLSKEGVEHVFTRWPDRREEQFPKFREITFESNGALSEEMETGWKNCSEIVEHCFVESNGNIPEHIYSHAYGMLGGYNSMVPPVLTDAS